MCFVKFCILIGILDEPFDFVTQLFYKSTPFDLILSCPLGFRAFSFKKLNKFFFIGPWFSYLRRLDWALVQGPKEAW